MGVELRWMRPDAPYMPVATVGILSALKAADVRATARWRMEKVRHVLSIETSLEPTEIVEAILAAPWPDLDAIPWQSKPGQAIKSVLGGFEDPIGELNRLKNGSGPAERCFLTALVTDSVLDDKGLPVRSRLLRGVKSDLSGVKEKVPMKPGNLLTELLQGPQWRNGKSGRGLGLVPEVQTFGGSTGRKPADVGSHSPLLYRLLWLGIMALPPIGVVRRGSRMVGGPLVSDGETMAWPVWESIADLRGLRALFSMEAVLDPQSWSQEDGQLDALGVTAIYSSEAVPINNMISVFRWGRRVL